MGVRLGIAPAIGLMLMNIGFGSNAGIYSDKGGPFYVMRDFFGSLTPGLARDTMGSGYSAMVLAVVTMFIGLLLSLYLLIRKLKVPFYLVCLLLVLSIGQAKLSSLILIHLHHLRVLLLYLHSQIWRRQPYSSSIFQDLLKLDGLQQLR